MNNLLIHVCKRCGHKWPSKNPTPKVCSGCHSVYWNQEKKSSVTVKIKLDSDLNDYLQTQADSHNQSIEDFITSILEKYEPSESDIEILSPAPTVTQNTKTDNGLADFI